MKNVKILGKHDKLCYIQMLSFKIKPDKLTIVNFMPTNIVTLLVVVTKN